MKLVFIIAVYITWVKDVAMTSTLTEFDFESAGMMAVNTHVFSFKDK